MRENDSRYVRQTLAMALGSILMAPNTDTKTEMIERLKRSIEKVDVDAMPDPMISPLAHTQTTPINMWPIKSS